MSFLSSEGRRNGGVSTFRDQRRSSNFATSSSSLSSGGIKMRIDNNEQRQRPNRHHDLYRQYDTSDDDDNSENEEERLLSELHGEAMDDGRKKRKINSDSTTSINKDGNNQTIDDIDNQYRTVIQHKKRIQRPTLTIDGLTGVDGLIRIPTEFTKKLRPIVPKNRNDINGSKLFCNTLLNCYQNFIQDLFPVSNTVLYPEEIYHRIEYTLGPNKTCRDYVDNMRLQQRDTYLRKTLGSDRATKLISELDEEIQLQHELFLEKLQNKQQRLEEKQHAKTHTPDDNDSNDDIDNDEEVDHEKENNNPEPASTDITAETNNDVDNVSDHASQSISPLPSKTSNTNTVVINPYSSTSANKKRKQQTQESATSPTTGDRTNNDDDDNDGEYEATFGMDTVNNDDCATTSNWLDEVNVVDVVDTNNTDESEKYNNDIIQEKQNTTKNSSSDDDNDEGEFEATFGNEDTDKDAISSIVDSNISSTANQIIDDDDDIEVEDNAETSFDQGENSNSDSAALKNTIDTTEEKETNDSEISVTNTRASTSMNEENNDEDDEVYISRNTTSLVSATVAAVPNHRRRVIEDSDDED